MNRSMEDRLRAAFEAKTSQVTRASLSRRAELDDNPLDDDVEGETLDDRSARPPNGSVRWFKPLAVAAAVAVVAGGIYVSANRASISPQPSIAATGAPSAPATTGVPAPPSGSSTPTTAHMPAPQSTGGGAPGGAIVGEAPRVEIPWAQVGPGWTAAVWSATVESPGPGTLYFLSPAGTRYAIGQVPRGTEVADVTADGRRILTRGGSNGVVTALEWDVPTGVSRPIPLPGTATLAMSYTKPSGKAILVQTTDGNANTLERRGLDGSLQLTYRDLGAQQHDGGISLLSTPDGLNLAIGTATGLVLVDNGGAAIRALPAPAGYASCMPRSWWSDGVILTSCLSTTARTNSAVSNLWLFPLSGAAPTALTKATPDGPGTGFSAAWRTSKGTLLERSATSCESSGPATLNTSGTGDDLKLNLPLDRNTALTIVSITGDTAFATVARCQPFPPGLSFIAYDLVKNTATYLLGAKANGGTVLSSLVIDPRR